MQKIPAPVYTVLKGEDFIRDVAYEASRAKHLVWGQTMDYEPGEITDRFTEVFSKAAKRGLDAKLNIDYYPLLMTDGLPNWVPLFNKERTIDRKRRLLAKIGSIHNLRDTNVDIHFLNRPGFIERIISTKGRNHIKLVIVDNYAWIGGINFHEFGFTSDDFMVKLSGSHLLRFLKQLYLHMHDNEPLFDITAHFNPDAKLFVDSGRVGKSIILDEAVHLIRSARESVDFSSAFYPDGKMLTALHAASLHGVRVRAVVPTFSNVKGLAKVVDITSEILMKIENKQIPVLMNRRLMHSKLIIIDNKTALFGSHNFTQRGVTMGTVEIAIASTNPALVRNLKEYYDYLLTGAVKDQQDSGTHHGHPDTLG
jgi:phosphatidylserine/phosphatidylglycerophosphate/cardiolipin synthase-like enzyme